MDAAVIIALIQTAGIIVVAGLGLWGVIIQFRNGRQINKIEVATNSMKDALVKSTGEAAHAAGKVEGLAEGAAVAALRDQGAETQRNKGT